MPAPPAARDDEELLDLLVDRQTSVLPTRPARPAAPAPDLLPPTGPDRRQESLAGQPDPHAPPAEATPEAGDATEAEPPAAPAPRPARPDVRLAIRAPRRSWPPRRQLAIHAAVVAAIIAIFILVWAIWR